MKYCDGSAMRMDQSVCTDEMSFCDSTSVQTELCGKDVYTMKDLNEMMMQKMVIRGEDIPKPKGLIITPENCLEFEFNEIQSSSSEDSMERMDDYKDEKKEK